MLVEAGAFVVVGVVVKVEGPLRKLTGLECTIYISIEDTPSIGPDVDTPVNAWITGDDVGTDRSEPMSGVVDLEPWKRVNRGIPLNN